MIVVAAGLAGVAVGSVVGGGFASVKIRFRGRRFWLSAARGRLRGRRRRRICGELRGRRRRRICGLRLQLDFRCALTVRVGVTHRPRHCLVLLVLVLVRVGVIGVARVAATVGWRWWWWHCGAASGQPTRPAANEQTLRAKSGCEPQCTPTFCLQPTEQMAQLLTADAITDTTNIRSICT